MKRFVLVLLLMLTAVLSGGAQPPSDAIIGEWVAPQKDSRIRIYRQGNSYFGRITWGTGGPDKDVKNPDPAKRNRELIGLTILNDFVFNGKNSWEDGTIYDPREGKTYSCKLTLKDSKNLSIRGYVGVSLFGRTEVWTKFN
ncbi:DUF2147 domain-containing protein [Larkinella sp. VNQ87]|uniref:DUF2147 domain-containing protein n=1 Tax=Larkinella sp. VNQ87 TaxID=3400921 RepID=UPI003C03BC93